MDGKLNSAEMRQWDWHAYILNTFKGHARRQSLFDDEYDEMFTPLTAAQEHQK
jgi:hypothetical protein